MKTQLIFTLQGSHRRLTLSDTANRGKLYSMTFLIRHTTVKGEALTRHRENADQHHYQ